jgi:2-polyprenyl-6-methoxyphenol hydroxylase-like FAD-dependent oxidoreductase
MAGFLLARAGVDVVVLEKHADFFRDFCGDTIHPSTLEVMHELGLLDEFLMLPHSKAVHLGAQVGETFVPIADFSHLPTRCKFIALMPQWDFLDFLGRQGRRYPGFHLMMGAEAPGLLRNGDTVTARSWSSPPMDEPPRCVRWSASSQPSSARRWTYCGCDCRAAPATRRTRSVGWMPGA